MTVLILPNNNKPHNQRQKTYYIFFPTYTYSKVFRIQFCYHKCLEGKQDRSLFFTWNPAIITYCTWRK
jgi:hypothetical protein